MSNRPKVNLSESVLARAELFRRGMLFEGVPSFDQPLQMPAPPAGTDSGASSPGVAGPSPAGAPAPVPGAADALTAGAVKGDTPLETLLAP